MAGWHKVGRLEEVQEGDPLGSRVAGVPVAVFRIGDRCYAVHDVCTHEFALLSKGYQEGEIVECPLHQARFNVVTGECLSLPATRDLATYEVKIENGDVYVMEP